jgi:hypothetical protein
MSEPEDEPETVPEGEPEPPPEEPPPEPPPEEPALTSAKVEAVFRASLYPGDIGDEIPEGAVLIRGIMTSVGFDPVGLEENKAAINALVDELPELFASGVGGGGSFLALCDDRNGRQWGEHRNMEMLMLLGIAIDRMAYLLPREQWHMLPGSLPYVVVKPLEDA